MAPTPEVIFLGAPVLAFLLFLISCFFPLHHRKARRILRVGALVPLLCFAGLFLAATSPGMFPWLVPYQHLGTYETTDLEGRPARVEVYAKSLSNSIPPGVLPRLKLVGSTSAGSDSITLDLGWRFWIGPIRPVEGGIEVFHSYPRGTGIRFVISGDTISVGKSAILGTAPRELLELNRKVDTDTYTLLKKIYHVTGIEGGWFHPTALVRAVNALQAAGKEESVRVIRAYLAWSSKTFGPTHNVWLEKENDRVLLILRLLFVPDDPEDVYPALAAGLPQRGSDDSIRRWPTYPIVLIEDHPFLFAPYQGRYAHPEGTGERPDKQLEYYLEHFGFRQEPLKPKGSPLDALKALETSDLWSEFEATERKHFYLRKGGLRVQALLALSTMSPTTAWEYNALTSHEERDSDDTWKKKITEIEGFRPRWAPTRQDFIPSPQ